MTRSVASSSASRPSLCGGRCIRRRAYPPGKLDKCLRRWSTQGMDCASATASAGRRHPLDPITADEIARAATLLREHPDCPGDVRFVSISTAEPPRGAADPVRAAEAVLHQVARRETIEAQVDLDAGAVTDWLVLTGVEPQMTEAEFLAIEA